MRYFILSLLLISLPFTKSIACSCSPRTPELIHSMHDYYEVIFTGTVITADSWNDYLLDRSNNNRESSEVYMRVDSVIKGNLKVGQVIFIYQTLGGCTEMFEYDSKKLVFGRVMKKLSYIESEKDTTNYPPPGPPLGLEEDGSYVVSDHLELYDFLNFKLKHYSVIDTGMCSTFNYQSRAYKEVIEWLKQ